MYFSSKDYKIAVKCQKVPSKILINVHNWKPYSEGLQKKITCFRTGFVFNSKLSKILSLVLYSVGQFTFL